MPQPIPGDEQLTTVNRDPLPMNQMVQQNLIQTAIPSGTREVIGPAGAIIVSIGGSDEQYWLGQGYVPREVYEAKAAAAKSQEEALEAAKKK